MWLLSSLIPLVNLSIPIISGLLSSVDINLKGFNSIRLLLSSTEYFIAFAIVLLPVQLIAYF